MDIVIDIGESQAGQRQWREWRKSSRSAGGECVEVGGWRKSSYSAYNGNCVEVADGEAVIAVRDTQDRGGPVLAFPAGTWAAFTKALKAS